MAEAVDEKSKSKLAEDEIADMKLDLDDRAGQLLQTQQEEVAIQAPMTNVPQAFAPPGLLLPNGFHFGGGLNITFCNIIFLRRSIKTHQ